MRSSFPLHLATAAYLFRSIVGRRRGRGSIAAFGCCLGFLLSFADPSPQDSNWGFHSARTFLSSSHEQSVPSEWTVRLLLLSGLVRRFSYSPVTSSPNRRNRSKESGVRHPASSSATRQTTSAHRTVRRCSSSKAQGRRAAAPKRSSNGTYLGCPTKYSSSSTSRTVNRTMLPSLTKAT